MPMVWAGLFSCLGIPVPLKQMSYACAINYELLKRTE